MGTKPPKTSMILGAIGFALVCFILIVFVWRSFGGTVPLEAQAYRMHILFSAEGSQLSEGSDVRIAGVKVGHVVGTEAVGDSLEAEIEMDPEFAPVATDAKAIVRTKTLLGEGFVELAPGTAELAAGAGWREPAQRAGRDRRADRPGRGDLRRAHAKGPQELPRRARAARSTAGRRTSATRSATTAPTLADIHRRGVRHGRPAKVALKHVLIGQRHDL